MNNAPLEIDEATNLLLNAPVPLLFLDTCAILDIIRLPFRVQEPSRAKSHLAAAQDAINLISNEKLKIILLPNVPTEYNDNIANTKEELSKYLNTIDKSIKVLKSLQLSTTVTIPDNFIYSLNTIETLDNICTNILSNSIHIKESDTLVLRANTRVVRDLPPSRKGSIKDCIIYEHCLELSRQLRDNGFTETLIFHTSNTKDFCDSNHPKQEIKLDIDELDINFCTDWSWAASFY